MDTLERVPKIEDVESEVEERLEVFVRAYVSEFDKKLEEYAKEAEVGGIPKTGKLNSTLGAPLGTAASAGAGLIGGVVGLVGKAIGEKAVVKGSKYFSGRRHRKKAKQITQIFQSVTGDELRKMFVEAGSLIYYSFQTQFESVTDADGNWRRALSKLAIDARNRTISYLYNEETTVAIEALSKDLLTKALILGESKDSYLSHVTPKKMQQIIPGTKPGHTLKNESKEWKTSDIYEQVGIRIVGSNGQTKYYKKKMYGNDYGYRWAFIWENDLTRISKYVEEYSRNVSEDPRTLLKLEELEAKTIQILANINKEDTKLQLTSIKHGVDESKEAVDRMQQDLHDIKTTLSELPKSYEPKIFTVKQPVKTFTGRERELAILHDELQTQQKQVVVSQCASISGLGGMGKSELARKYAHTYHECYGSCIWIDSETQSSTIQSFRQLAEELQIPITHKSFDGERNTLLIVKDIYKHFSNSKSLFIFDNVNQYEDIEDYMPSNLSPTDEKPTIIITSRNSDWDIGDEGDVGLILLDQFTPGEALSFVKKVLEIKDEDKSLDSSISELTAELCCFPLALRQAASYIKAKKRLNSAIDSYLGEFRDEKKKRHLMQYITKRDRYTETTYTTWEITFKNVEKNEANGPLAIRLVEVMAYLAADNIPLKGFIGLPENKEKLKEAVDILLKYSIITVKETYEEDGQSDEGNCFYGNTAYIHRLVQQVIRLWLHDEKREEDVLGMALIKVHDQIDAHHAATLWTYVCDYTTLINKYFCKIYEERKFYFFMFAVDYLVKDGDVGTIRKIFDYLEGRSDLWHELCSYILSIPLVECNHNDLNIEITGHETHIKAVYVFHAEVQNALKHSNAQDLKQFLQSFDKSLINSLFYNYSALEWSALIGSLNVVKILIESGADVNTPRRFNRRDALYMAANGNHLEVVEYLLDQGAESTTINRKGWTVLECASHHGYLDIVKRLTDKISDCENGAQVLWRSLRLAILNDQVEIVEFLTNHRVYVNEMTDRGQTMCRMAAESGSIHVVKYLIDNKLANVNETLLFAAVSWSQFNVTKYLLSDETPDKVDINAFNVLGYTPLFQAVLRGNIEIASLLIEHGAAVDNVQNENTLLGQLNISVLHLAAACDCLEIVKLLVEECNADINMGLNTTFSPLQVAQYFDNEEVCEFLIRNGADTSEWCKDNLGNITCILRSFYEENTNAASAYNLFHECSLVLDNLNKYHPNHFNQSRHLEDRLNILRCFLKELESDICLDHSSKLKDSEK